MIERLRDNLAKFKQIHFKKWKKYQDVTCKRSIKMILVQILNTFLFEISQVFPQPNHGPSLPQQQEGLHGLACMV